MNPEGSNCQYLYLRPDYLNDPADPAGPIAFARFLIFSGYPHLGFRLLAYILPDDPQHPCRKKRRHGHILDVLRQSNRYRLVSVATPWDLQDGDFFISAFDLQIDRTGRELQRIAAFLEDTGHNHIAALVRRQRPQPMERDLYPPDYMWRDLFRGPDTGRKYPMLKPDAITIHPNDFDHEVRSDTFLALAYILAPGNLEELAASFLHIAHAEDRQARDLEAYLTPLPQITQSIQTAPPYFITQPFAVRPADLFLTAFDLYTDQNGETLDRLAGYLESIGLGALADRIRTESPDPHTRRHYLPSTQTA
jgi:hypothetical protein